MNKKVLIKVLKNLLFLAIGIGIFYLLFKSLKVEPSEIADGFRETKYFWIFTSIFFAILSQVSRALRWRMLMRPMGYNPDFTNTFLSIFIMYLVNLAIPRAGEVARCSVLTKYNKVPFTKLVGTVIVERLADTLMLALLGVIILAWNFDFVLSFIEKNPMDLEKFSNYLTPMYILLAIAVLIVVIIAFWFLLKKYKEKIIDLKNQFIEGITTIKKLDQVWAFIGHTCFIFLMWLVMLYVVFLAYEPTAHLTIRIAMVTFLMGGLAMLFPIQGGIGPWHFMVIQALVQYGVAEKQAGVFSIIAHTTTNLVYIILGAVAFIILLIVNNRRAQSLKS